jgi:hypothetical protein
MSDVISTRTHQIQLTRTPVRLVDSGHLAGSELLKVISVGGWCQNPGTPCSACLASAGSKPQTHPGSPRAAASHPHPPPISLGNQSAGPAAGASCTRTRGGSQTGEPPVGTCHRVARCQLRHRVRPRRCVQSDAYLVRARPWPVTSCASRRNPRGLASQCITVRHSVCIQPWMSRSGQRRGAMESPYLLSPGSDRWRRETRFLRSFARLPSVLPLLPGVQSKTSGSGARCQLRTGFPHSAERSGGRR